MATPPDVLVLGPGGMKGFYHLGALSFLHEKHYLDRITTIIGVSIGAGIGLLMCLGYSIYEIIIFGLKNDLFQDVPKVETLSEIFKKEGVVGLLVHMLSKIDSITEMLGRQGVITNRLFQDQLIRMAKLKFGFVPSLLQLYNLSGIHFITVTSNWNKKEPVYIDYKTFPEMNCVDAVLLSVNIPGLMARIEYDGNTYVDGAFTDPYPVWVMDEEPHHVLGLAIVSDASANPTTNISDTLHYVYQSFTLSMHQMRKLMRAYSSDRVTHLWLHHAKLVDAIGLYLTPSDKLAMIDSGMKQAREWWEGNKL